MIDLFHPPKVKPGKPSFVHNLFKSNCGAKRIYTAEEFAAREKKRKDEIAAQKRLKFKVGDKVTWKSNTTVKEGIVVAVMEPRVLPIHWPIWKLRPSVKPRNYESYVVQVRQRLYWPHVSGLKHVAVPTVTPPKY